MIRWSGFSWISLRSGCLSFFRYSNYIFQKSFAKLALMRPSYRLCSMPFAKRPRALAAFRVSVLFFYLLERAWYWCIRLSGFQITYSLDGVGTILISKIREEYSSRGKYNLITLIILIIQIPTSYIQSACPSSWLSEASPDHFSPRVGFLARGAAG
jgi:hypothetical protein